MCQCSLFWGRLQVLARERPSGALESWFYDRGHWHKKTIRVKPCLRYSYWYWADAVYTEIWYAESPPWNRIRATEQVMKAQLPRPDEELIQRMHRWQCSGTSSLKWQLWSISRSPSRGRSHILFLFVLLFLVRSIRPVTTPCDQLKKQQNGSMFFPPIKTIRQENEEKSNSSYPRKSPFQTVITLNVKICK